MDPGGGRLLRRVTRSSPSLRGVLAVSKHHVFASTQEVRSVVISI